MTGTLSPPRWRGGSAICLSVNLPAFATRTKLIKWLDTNSPGVHAYEIFRCKSCNQWHALTLPRSPSGESSGTGRRAK
jgi:hypothetical protein